MSRKTDYQKMWKKEKTDHKKTIKKLLAANDIMEVQADIIKKLAKKNRILKAKIVELKLNNA